jgi:hypothetical protein
VTAFRMEQRHSGLKLMANSSKGTLSPLPLWANYLMSIGAWLAEQPADLPGTVALVAPSRLFLAVLAGMGVVHTRRLVSMAPSCQFREAFDAAGDVPVRFQYNGVEVRGIVVERRERTGVAMLGVAQVRKKTAVTLYPQHLVSNLVIEERSGRARHLVFTDPWMAHVLDGCDPTQYMFASRHDLLIVGQDKALRRDATLELKVDRGPGEERPAGCIDCILRVRRWVGEHRIFSSDVLPTSSDTEDIDLGTLRRFPVVIFDGAAAFLNWAHHFPQQQHLVVLSRVDRHLEDAVAALEKAYLMRGLDWQVPTPPASLEVLAFGRPQ